MSFLAAKTIYITRNGTYSIHIEEMLGPKPQVGKTYLLFEQSSGYALRAVSVGFDVAGQSAFFQRLPREEEVTDRAALRRKLEESQHDDVA